MDLGPCSGPIRSVAEAGLRLRSNARSVDRTLLPNKRRVPGFNSRMFQGSLRLARVVLYWGFMRFPLASLLGLGRRAAPDASSDPGVHAASGVTAVGRSSEVKVYDVRLPETSALATRPVTAAPLARTTQLIDALTQRMDAWRLDERPTQHVLHPNETAESLAALERAATALADHLEKSSTKAAMTGSARAELAREIETTHAGHSDLTSMVFLSSRPALIRAAQKIDYALASRAQLERRIREEIVEHLVDRVRAQPGQSWEAALNAALSSGVFPGPYTEELKSELAAARVACAREGLDLSALLNQGATQAQAENGLLPHSSTAAIFELCKRPLAEDLVLYTWQSARDAAAMLKDPAAHWASVAKSGVYFCESPVRTSGYAGGTSFGTMVELRVPKGTIFSDIDKPVVRSELQRRDAYHNSARTPEGTMKPLNKYGRIERWWQVPSFEGLEVRPFDPSAMPTRKLLLMIAEALPPGLPFVVESVNNALSARGEHGAGGLAPAIDQALRARLERKLEKWSEEQREGKPYSSHSGGAVDLLGSMLEIGKQHPGVAEHATKVIRGLKPAEREELIKQLELREEGPPPDLLELLLAREAGPGTSRMG